MKKDRIIPLLENKVPIKEVAVQVGCSEKYVREIYRATYGHLREPDPPVTTKERQTILDMWQRDCPVSEIITATGRSQTTIRRLTRKAGLKRKRVHPLDVPEERVLELWKAGRTRRYISIDVGCDMMTVSKIAQKHGVSRPYGWNRGLVSDEQLLALYRELGSVSAVAKKIKRQYNTVWSRLHRIGARVNTKQAGRRSTVPLDRLETLYQELGSFSAVGKVVGQKANTVSERLRRHWRKAGIEHAKAQ